MDDSLEEALALAAGSGHKHVVLLLLEQGATFNEALHFAAANGHLDIVQALLKAKPDSADMPDRHNRTPFIWAVWNGYEEIASYLVERGADYKKMRRGITALHVAARMGQSKIIQQLIKAGVDVNATDHDGANALMLAAGAGFDNVIRLLLVHGASATSQSKLGWTALHCAIV